MLQTQNLLTINKNTMNMKTLDMKAWAESARNGRRRLAIPIMTHPGIELCGYTVRDAVTDGEVHARAILALNDRYPADACSVIMDLTVEAEAFGAHIVFPENEVPSVTDTLVHDLSEIEALKIPTLEAGRIPQYLKANRIVAEALGDKPLFAGCIGPFSLAGRLFGMTELMMATFTEPETIQLLLKKCTRFIGDYCIALKKSGAQGVVIAEPAAGLISNEDCSLYSSLYVRRIVELVQDDHFWSCCTTAAIRGTAPKPWSRPVRPATTSAIRPGWSQRWKHVPLTRWLWATSTPWDCSSRRPPTKCTARRRNC